MRTAFQYENGALLFFHMGGWVFIIFTIEDVKRTLCCADNKATKLLRELEKFGLIERKRRGQGKPSLVYVKNFSAESSKESVKNRDNDDSCGFKIACQDPAKSRCNKTKENDTEMSETDPFYSEESDGMSKRTQLEEYFSQSLEVELLLRLCPDDEDAGASSCKEKRRTVLCRRKEQRRKNKVPINEDSLGPFSHGRALGYLFCYKSVWNKRAACIARCRTIGGWAQPNKHFEFGF